MGTQCLGWWARGKPNIAAHKKKEIDTEVKSKDQEDDHNEHAQKEGDPNTEHNIKD